MVVPFICLLVPARQIKSITLQLRNKGRLLFVRNGTLQLAARIITASPRSLLTY